MNLKIVKVLLICVVVCSTIMATTVTTLNLRQTYAARSSRTTFTSEGKSSRIVLVGDPLPSGGWPKSANQTGN